ncbi:hypothetical protein GGF32_009744 [Allomyces javanicus]|nr:hypothetical protein GGF32_009744 [Allomyces javanicus]
MLSPNPTCTTISNCSPAKALRPRSLAELAASVSLARPPPAARALVPGATVITAKAETLLYAPGAMRLTDRGRALDLFVSAANLGNVQAMGLAGFMLEFGPGIAQSYEGCEAYYQSAAERGHVLSMTRLADLTKRERPKIQANRAEAEQTKENAGDESHPLAWLWRAATDKNCPAAQYAIGTCFPDGIGEAIRSTRFSAQGEPRAFSVLGFCYATGFGVRHDGSRAIWYYRHAALRGETTAMYQLGQCFATGPVPNFALSHTWYRRAARAGNALAANALGFTYKDGRGVPRDLTAAASWFRRSAEFGNAESQCILRKMLSVGAGIPHQLDESFKWLLSAAEQYEVGAMVLVGNAYQYRHGVRENAVEAVWWYVRAAKLREPIACLILASCAESGSFPSSRLHLAIHDVRV